MFVFNKYIIPAAHDALIRVFNTVQPQKDMLALIEPKISTPDTIKNIPQDKVWHALVVTKTVIHSCVKQSRRQCKSVIPRTKHYGTTAKDCSRHHIFGYCNT